jgi:hypothetical protein
MGIKTVFCQNCGFVFTNPRPTEKEMVNFYKTAYRRIYQLETSPRLLFRKRKEVEKAKSFYSFIVPELKKLNLNSPKILHINCHAGTLLGIFYFNLQKSKRFAVEPIKAFAEYVQKNTKTKAYNETLEKFVKKQKKIKRKFDLIILNQVIENTQNPIKKLKLIYQLLNKGGILVLHSPNFISSQWPYALQRFHLINLNHFTPPTLKNILNITGFKIVKKLNNLKSIEPWMMTYLCRRAEKSSKIKIKILNKKNIAKLRNLLNRLTRQASKENFLIYFYSDKFNDRALKTLKRIELSYKKIGLLSTLKKIYAICLHLIRRNLWRQTKALLKNRPFSLIMHFFLKKCIENQKIIIIGSGPSTKQLKHIPADVKIFTCNNGIKILKNKKINKQIDLYTCHLGSFTTHPDLKNTLPQTKINNFLIHEPGYIKRNFEKFYQHLFFHDNKDSYYLKKVIKPYRIDDLPKNFIFSHTSTGMRLLQYALFFKAKEIFLIGFDLGEKGYSWGGVHFSDYKNVDQKFLEIVAKKYNNVYSLSRNSPIAKYFKVKSF